ncbi:MAG TPA: pilus assembly protein CpaE [Marmoricola sp.]|nr:pilus assembly protein CpaE [Marmoricola sp.]
MISIELARRLRRAGVVWFPRPGDRFVLPERDLDDTVFTISDMVVEVHELPSARRVIAFNGTTEWALDSLDQREALWLPREDQLRTLLGVAFVALESRPEGFAVVVRGTAGTEQHVGQDAEDAYARAVLACLAG